MNALARQLKNRTALLVLFAGLFLGSLFVDVGQLALGRGFSAMAINRHEVLETDLATWVAYTDPKVRITVLTLPECRECVPDEVLIWLRRVIPTMEVNLVDVSSGEGKRLAMEMDIRSVPAFVFDSTIRDTSFYREAQTLFTEKNSHFLFDTKAIGLPTGRFLYSPRSDDADIIIGKKSGVKTFVTFLDPSCEACGKFVEQSIIPLTLAGEAEFRIKPLELSASIPTRSANTALLCAERQGKGEAMLRELFRTRDTWTRIKDPTNYFVGTAVRQKLDVRVFMTCQKDDSINEAARFEIEKSPTTIFDGRVITGAVSLDDLKKAGAEAR
jgi:hypothetical protein